ncbi:hypothetical protein BGZ91_009007, partial [Linnemannia elongata]
MIARTAFSVLVLLLAITGSITGAIPTPELQRRAGGKDCFCGDEDDLRRRDLDFCGASCQS